MHDTTSQKLISDAERVIQRAREAIELVRKNWQAFDQFGIHSSFDAFQGGAFFLHDAPEDSKPFCRAIGGTWTKESNGTEGFNYRGKGDFDFHIFNAERKPVEPLVL